MDSSFEKLIDRVLDNRYKIENVVGIGGMAYVLKAIDLKDESKPVAIKILSEEFNSDENAVKRFVNESKAVAMVDSENIVKIYDVAMSDNLKYIVMEFVDGITLKDYIDKVGRLGWKEACHYVRQILSAMSHAHEKGIIHRDIKPQNVMLLRDGKVKVTDFGIAKMPTSEPLTMTDKAIGTVNYISPEQASGGVISEKSDLYSVGVMLYEMLTGKLPFTAESPVAVAMMQVSEIPVAPRQINPQIPIGLEQIILKAMSKDPEERFGTALSMEKAIEYFVKNPATVFSGVSSDGKKINKNEQKNKKQRSMFPVILGITVAFLAVCVTAAAVIIFKYGEGIFGMANNESNKIVIEDYVGQQYSDELRAYLEDKGFLVVEKLYEMPNEEHGKIMNQDPIGGSKKIDPKRGGRVTLTLYVNNNPAESYVMPQCLDISLTEAKDMILTRFDGIISEDDIVIKENFREASKGTVYECNPGVGASIDIENPPKITLYVSKGPEPKEVTMPEVIGLSKSEARKLLEQESITYTEKREYSDEPVNTVIRTSIKEGEKFMNDTEVIVYISEKNRGESFIMPDCIGDKKSVALSEIRKRFKIDEKDVKIVEEYKEDVKKGVVYKTIPEANTMITDFTSTKITLYVSLGAEPMDTMMPSVTGRYLSEAKRLLSAASLTNVRVEYMESGSEENLVIAANFAAGDVIFEDSEIVLYVSLGEGTHQDENTSIDDLLGMAGRE